MNNIHSNGVARPDGQKPRSGPVLPVVTPKQRCSPTSRSVVSLALYRAQRRRAVLREEENRRALRTAINVTGSVLLVFAFLLAGVTLHQEMKLQQQDEQALS